MKVISNYAKTGTYVVVMTANGTLDANITEQSKDSFCLVKE